MPLAVNPPFDQLGRINAIVGGRAREHAVRSFSGPLSIKSVIRGTAVWTTGSGRFELTPGQALIIGDGEEYSMEVDSLHPVETFCIFFRDGYVEDAARSLITDSATLLDACCDAPVPFVEPLSFDIRTFAALNAVRSEPEEESLSALALVLARTNIDRVRRVFQLTPRRLSTRHELARRVAMATAYMHGHLGQAISLEDIASAACLSPFHFHRVFREVHGQTPHGYLAGLRFQRACALLRQTRRSVVEVAGDCGYESISTFTTWFTKRAGMSPMKFRKIEEAGLAARD